MDSLTDMIQLGLSNLWTYGASFLAVLGLLVFVHEWGHYIVARMCGVRVETFSIDLAKKFLGGQQNLEHAGKFLCFRWAGMSKCLATLILPVPVQQMK